MAREKIGDRGDVGGDGCHGCPRRGTGARAPVAVVVPAEFVEQLFGRLLEDEGGEPARRGHRHQPADDFGLAVDTDVRVLVHHSDEVDVTELVGAGVPVPGKTHLSRDPVVDRGFALSLESLVVAICEKHQRVFLAALLDDELLEASGVHRAYCVDHDSLPRVGWLRCRGTNPSCSGRLGLATGRTTQPGRRTTQPGRSDYATSGWDYAMTRTR